MERETEREGEWGWRRTKKRRIGTGTGAGTGTDFETRGRAQDENGDGDGDGKEVRTGSIEGGSEAKKRKKPHKNCKRDVGNRGNLGGERRICREENVGSVAAYPDNLENSKEEWRKEQNTRGFSKMLYK